MELRTVLAVALRPHQLTCDLSQVARKAYHPFSEVHAQQAGALAMDQARVSARAGRAGEIVHVAAQGASSLLHVP